MKETNIWSSKKVQSYQTESSTFYELFMYDHHPHIPLFSLVGLMQLPTGRCRGVRRAPSFLHHIVVAPVIPYWQSGARSMAAKSRYACILSIIAYKNIMKIYVIVMYCVYVDVCNIQTAFLPRLNIQQKLLRAWATRIQQGCWDIQGDLLILRDFLGNLGGNPGNCASHVSGSQIYQGIGGGILKASESDPQKKSR